jgi:hypothetical protein
MDASKAQVIDGVLWPPNTIEPRDILTVGRVFNYDSPAHGMTRLTVHKVDETHCHTIGDDQLRYKDAWVDLDINRIHL